ncbi:MAG: hypothetical protein QW116_04400 [Zestosphaera sp.]
MLGVRMIRSLLCLAMYYHELSPVKVAVFRDLGRVSIGEGFEILTKGVEASLPLWLAEYLSKVGLVEVKENSVGPQDVAMALINERESGDYEFTQLKPRFYPEVKRLLNRVREASASDPEAALSLVKLESNFDDLIQYRLRKIMKLALLSKEDELEEFMDKILLEEGALLRMLKSLVSGWRGVMFERKQ